MSSVNEESLALLTSMGFPEADSRIALHRTNNDVNHAVELLSNGLSEGDDAEFDLIAAAGPEPNIRPATVFQERSTHGVGHSDHFAEGITQGTIPEMVDSRISSLTEMGFSAAQAEDALREHNGDVNEALNALLNA